MNARLNPPERLKQLATIVESIDKHPTIAILLFIWTRQGSAVREDIERFMRGRRSTGDALADLVKIHRALTHNVSEDRYSFTEAQFWKFTPVNVLPEDWHTSFRLPEELNDALAASADPPSVTTGVLSTAAVCTESIRTKIEPNESVKAFSSESFDSNEQGSNARARMMVEAREMVHATAPSLHAKAHALADIAEKLSLPHMARLRGEIMGPEPVRSMSHMFTELKAKRPEKLAQIIADAAAVGINNPAACVNRWMREALRTEMHT